MRRSLRAGLSRLGLLAAGLLAGALLAEALARVVRPNGSSDLLFGAPDASPAGLYVNDHALVMRPAPGFSATSGSLGYSVPQRIKSRGLRGPEPSPGSEPRWLCVGDSFTMAAQVREEQTFPALLGTLTGASFHNAGVDGYSTWQALRRYEQLDDRLGTGGVLLTFFLGNDLDDNEALARHLDRARGLREGEPIPREAVGWLESILGRHSYLYAHVTVFGRVRALRAGRGSEAEFRRNELCIFAPEGEGRLAALLPGTRAALAGLRDAARARGDRLLVAVAPPAFAVDPARAQDTLPIFGLAVTDQGLRAPGQAVLAMLADLGVEACDLTPALAEAVARGERPFFTFDGHWTPRGHALVAKTLAARLEALPPAAPAPAF
jgi:hypothetical protein